MKILDTIKNIKGTTNWDDTPAATVETINTALASHTEVKGAQSTLGHIKVDGATLAANAEGIVSTVNLELFYITASTSLALTNKGQLVLINSTSDITITIPTNANVAFPIGTIIEFIRYNTGKVIFSAASGVTLLSRDSYVNIDGQYGSAVLMKTDTNTWLLIGALCAS